MSEKKEWYDLDKFMGRRTLVDRIIESFLDSSDKTKFTGKDKILFYK